MGNGIWPPLQLLAHMHHLLLVENCLSPPPCSFRSPWLCPHNPSAWTTFPPCLLTTFYSNSKVTFHVSTCIPGGCSLSPICSLACVCAWHCTMSFFKVRLFLVFPPSLWSTWGKSYKLFFFIFEAIVLSHFFPQSKVCVTTADTVDKLYRMKDVGMF